MWDKARRLDDVGTEYRNEEDILVRPKIAGRRRIELLRTVRAWLGETGELSAQ
jgi:hypothetical protein